VGFVALSDSDAAVAEDGERGRSGNRETAVRAANPARAFDDRRGEHARFAQHFEREAAAYDVHDGIHRADFVEVNLIRRLAVDLPLGVGNALEHSDGLLLHPRGELAPRDQLLDVGERPLLSLVVVFVIVFARVMIMRMALVVLVAMIVFMFVFASQVDVELRTSDAGLLAARDVKVVAVELEFPEFALNPARVGAQVNQPCDKHVAADAAEDVEVEGFHGRAVLIFISIFILIIVDAESVQED
jgi:hypothetical protein